MAIDRRSEPHTTNERFAGNFISETASQRATGVRHEIDRKAPYTLPESTGRIYDPCPRAVDTARGHGSLYRAEGSRRGVGLWTRVNFLRNVTLAMSMDAAICTIH